MKVVLITGASGGIGEAFARQLAADGHHLLLVARSADKLSQLCTELTQAHRIMAQFVALDLAAPGADEQLFTETQQRGLEVEWLLNNAGIGSAGDFTRLDLTSEQALLALNIEALTALTHRYLPQMRARRSGTIINVASLAAFQPVPFMATYAASKAYVRSFTEAIAAENQPFGIRVLLLAPGATETNFFEAAKIGAANKADIGVTNVETPAQVVKSALAGLRMGKQLVISGFKNKLMVRLSHFVPNALVAKLVARQLRPKFQA